jgi:hypothetical protein
LPWDPGDLGFKFLIPQNFIDILKILYTKFLDHTSKPVSCFGFQDAIARRGALSVLINLFRHFLKSEILMKLDK